MKLHIALAWLVVSEVFLATVCAADLTDPVFLANLGRAYTLFPTAGIAGTPLNKAVHAEIARLKVSNPATFEDKKWPLRIFASCAVELGAPVSAPVPAAAEPKKRFFEEPEYIAKKQAEEEARGKADRARAERMHQRKLAEIELKKVQAAHPDNSSALRSLQQSVDALRSEAVDALRRRR
jgi:hypothetical protein